MKRKEENKTKQNYQIFAVFQHRKRKSYTLKHAEYTSRCEVSDTDWSKVVDLDTPPYSISTTKGHT